ncbi:MAG TPA: hypothetical protein VII92_10675 [Anaerolineae bacterium]
MPRIRCNYEGCIHLEGGLCTADDIDLDQELGCLTFSQVEEEEIAVVDDLEDEWADDEIATAEDEDEEEEDWEDLDEEEDDDDDDEDEDDDSFRPAPRSRRKV